MPDEISPHPLYSIYLINSVLPSAPASYKIFHYLGLYRRKYYVGGSEVNGRRSSPNLVCSSVQHFCYFNLFFVPKYLDYSLYTTMDWLSLCANFILKFN